MRTILQLIGISLAVFLASLDTALVNIAVQPIAESFQIPIENAIWVVVVYHLALLCSMFFWGNLGEKITHRNLMLGGLLVFICTSLVCGWTSDFVVLIIARFVQGLGASAILVSNLALIRKIARPEELGKIIGWNAMVIAAGFSIGPSLASFLLQSVAWPFLFYLNLPLGIISLIILWTLLPNQASSNISFDWIRNIIVAVGLFFLFLSLDFIAKSKFDHWPYIGLLMSGILLFIVCRNMIQQRIYILPFDLLQHVGIRRSLMGTIALFFYQSMGYILFPLVLQQIYHLAITNVGYYISPWPLLATLFAPLAGILSDRYSSTMISCVGLGIITIGFLGISLLNQDIHPVYFGVLMGCCGLGFGFFQSPNLKHVVQLAPASRHGAASSLLGFTRVLGQVLGALFVSNYLEVFTIFEWKYAVIGAVALGCFALVILSRSLFLNSYSLSNSQK